MVYLDYNATTPLDPRVREAMLPFLGEIFGNPSSVHAAGRAARAALDDARERVAGLWKCKPGEIVFTSGGSEANSLAILGAAKALRNNGQHMVTSEIEHRAVLAPMRDLTEVLGFTSTQVSTDPFGIVSLDQLKGSINDRTVLVSIMAANNEIGSLQPVREISEICHRRGILFHTDAVQWFGKEPLQDIHQFGADLVSFCAHKVFGPKGIGILYIRSPLKLKPLISGGSQENEQRAGTENLAAIAGAVRALELFTAEPAFARPVLEPLTAELEHRLLQVPEVRRWGPELALRLANTLAVSVAGCDSLNLLAGLDMEGICASGGSACSVGALEPSHVLQALGATREEASGLVRFSLGPGTTAAEIDFTARVFSAVVKRVRNSG